MQKLINQISNWIKEKTEEAGKEGAVIGLSGGLDSTITAFLCKKALGEKKVLGIIMPCRSNPKALEDAKLAAKFLKISSRCLDLTPVYDLFVSILPKGSPTSTCLAKYSESRRAGRRTGGNKIAEANLKPRLRMAALYYFANKFNYLVVGTGNKSECSVGYFTKYGDGAVDLLPLADIYKTELFELAKYINVPGEIINKPPSADLWEGQTDEEEMGITYKEMDCALKNLLENEKSAATAKEKLVEKMVKSSIHKKEFPPIFKKKR